MNYSVSCGSPIIPGNGSIEAYQNTLEGAEIFFKCDSGFVPAGRMTAVCGADGRWNPDPASLMCISKCVGYILIDRYILDNMDNCGPVFSVSLFLALPS